MMADRMRDAAWIVGLIAMPAAAMIAALLILSGSHETSAPRTLNWSQQSLRSVDIDACRAEHRVPQFADGIFLECLPEQTQPRVGAR